MCSAQNGEEKSVEKDNSEMEVLVDNISELASKVLEIFGAKEKLLSIFLRLFFIRKVFQNP